MITLRAVFTDGVILFTDEIPFSGRHDVLVTFLASDQHLDVIPREEARRILGQIRESDLTEREIEVIALVQKGATNEEIASILEISHGTTRNHLSDVYRKLKVKNRTQAIKRCIELGLLQPTKDLLG
jgi:LuxR family maltose regulon positive regulatory protein